ncbi:4-hydroxybenzoate 3-monooxygenase [Shimia sp.]|uniref:4-hydroxybenzoate 3-monooxygenase n=1 Tax=Shimia sp. TaxID=1954381 RepID=UPI003BABA44E
MRTQVAIIGGGPSGLLLGQLLHGAGIDTVVLERQSKAHVLSRIRAGILETGTVALMHQAGVGQRLEKECFRHDGTVICHGEMRFSVNFSERTGKHVVVYGQTDLTRDLYEAREIASAKTLFNIENVTIQGADSDTPSVSYEQDGLTHTIKCDFIAGCDGFHGVSRQTIPAHLRREYEKLYPFGWLGVLSETPPVHDELIYAGSDRGFALCSMRNANLSRYYIQCSLTDKPEDWSDTAFWEELKRRMPNDYADRLVTGASIEKSIAPLRSFVSEPMRWGRLFLCGDAAHIVPPTGAKGLNSAMGDVHYLFNGFRQFYEEGDSLGIDDYSAKALARVWKAERFSWATTKLLHSFPDDSEFDRKMRQAEVAFLAENSAAQTVFAQNYVGLPY